MKYVARGLGVAALFGAYESSRTLVQKLTGKIIDKTEQVTRDMMYDKDITDLDSSSISQARRLLFGTDDDVKIIPAKRHLINPKDSVGGQTAASYVATSKLIGLLGWERREAISEMDSLSTNRLDGNMCIVGGPIANRMAETIMSQDGLSKIIRDEYGNKFQFPFYINNSQAMRECNDGIRYIIKNGKKMPFWFIQKLKHRLESDKRNNKIINDYILLTSMPNFLDTTSLELGRRLVFFAGANGPGTKAIGLLLRNNSLLRAVEAKAQSVPRDSGWQVILHVDSIDSAEFPKALSTYMDFVELDIDWRRQSKIFGENI